MGREDWRKDLRAYSLTIWSTATLREVRTVTDITFFMGRTEKIGRIRIRDTVSTAFARIHAGERTRQPEQGVRPKA